ncbi:MAG: VWA domain-containing protein [Flavobacteriales bacterium]|nr:VWA domain-containing protein [Flavobacteriales bacterium]
MKRLVLSLTCVIIFYSISEAAIINLQTNKKHFLQITEQPHIQLAILLDTSSSMDGLIEQTKSQLWRIVNELATARYKHIQPVLEIALYEYGNDGLSAKDDYIRQVLAFTTDLDKVSEMLFGLKTNGGLEYCGSAIQHATTKLDWSPNNDDLKVIYIAGNESFSQGKIAYANACKDAISKGIVVNTIYCGYANDGIQLFWKQAADLAEGHYMNIDQNQSTVYIETPFDDELVQLNQALNNTYLAYGGEGKLKKENQVQQDKNAGGYGSANLAERTVSKSSAAYNSASWDLIDASVNESFNLEKMKDEDLPDALKGLSLAEKEKVIADMKKKREEVIQQIADLNKKRTEYINNKRKEMGTSSTLDMAMSKSIHSLAAKKNFTFETANP